MDFFIWLIIIGVVLSAIGGIVWWVFVFLLIKNAVSLEQRNLDSLLPKIEHMLQQATSTPAGRIDSQQKAQLTDMMMQAQNQMHQLDDLHRQRYDLRMGELMGMASSAGFEWRPGSY